VRRSGLQSLLPFRSLLNFLWLQPGRLSFSLLARFGFMAARAHRWSYSMSLGWASRGGKTRGYSAHYSVGTVSRTPFFSNLGGPLLSSAHACANFFCLRASEPGVLTPVLVSPVGQFSSHEFSRLLFSWWSGVIFLRSTRSFFLC
jgi:hypothetical protein